MVRTHYSIGLKYYITFLCICLGVMSSVASAASFDSVVEANELESFFDKEGGPAWASVIQSQYKSGYERFEEPGFYYKTLSDYALKKGAVYYSPINRTAVTRWVTAPKLMVRKPKEFSISQGGVAFDGKAVYYQGKKITKSAAPNELSYATFAFGKGIYVIKDHLSKKVPRYELVRIFDKVLVERIKPINDLVEKYRPVADGGFSQRWFTDGKSFYCIEGKGVESRRLQEPVTVNFIKSATPGVVNGNEWFRVGNNLDRGHIQFVEQKTGKKFDIQCKALP